MTNANFSLRIQNLLLGIVLIKVICQNSKVSHDLSFRSKVTKEKSAEHEIVVYLATDSLRR